ncbi:MAG: type II secretion system protein [Patescibacteria group bacterium]
MPNKLKKDSTAKNGGFTLIELLVVIAITSLISSIVLASLNTAKKKARDAQRLSDMKQLQIALEFYYDKNGQYPSNTDGDDICGGWDGGRNGGPGSSDLFMQPIEAANFMQRTPSDPIATGGCGGYAYYLYPAGNSGCPTTRGNYYVLGVRGMETSNGTYPGSPGWSCPPTRDWQTEFEWVIGKFEK